LKEHTSERSLGSPIVSYGYSTNARDHVSKEGNTRTELDSPARERRLGIFGGTGRWYSNIVEGEQYSIEVFGQ